jgi:hypothetical protein
MEVEDRLELAMWHSILLETIWRQALVDSISKVKIKQSK